MPRIWKTFYVQSAGDAGALKSALHNFPTPNHTARFDNFPGGGILETTYRSANCAHYSACPACDG